MDEISKPRVALLTFATLIAVLVLKVAGQYITDDYDKKVAAEKKRPQLQIKSIQLINKEQTDDPLYEVVARADLSNQRVASQIPAIENTRTPASIFQESTPADYETTDEYSNETLSKPKGSSAGPAIELGHVDHEGEIVPDENAYDADTATAFHQPGKSREPSSIATKADSSISFNNVTHPEVDNLPVPPKKIPIPVPTDPTSPVVSVVVTTSKPSGSYLLQPQITLSSENADSIEYCIGIGSGVPQCCDPQNAGITYSGPFHAGSADGNYCVSAKGYNSGTASALYTWNYVVDATMIALNFMMPLRTFFQTQQLHDAMIINSDEFGDASMTFTQRSSSTDPGPVTCDVLNTTTTADEMNSSVGTVVNFANVNAPFQIPLQLDNKIDYGVNYLVSIVERLSVREPASTDSEKICFKNIIELNDFHLDGVTASANQSFPLDGSYSLQGGLNFISSFPATGEAQGSNGVILEHGFINIIN